ncbi:unnamed protein product [Polarella glacialis]|uniref:Uncharacterized protein n=1 Tax=Polarella glacialis TaxID=89957 RepID=A0A813K1Y5_POLGL|nr:unnamed protein product [Polarella glacialis]
MLSKCWKELNLCSKVWPMIELVRSVGIDMGCSTDSQGCLSAITTACQDDAEVCTKACVKKTSLAVPVCRQECSQVCAQSGNISIACSLLKPPFATRFADVCPVECADANDPETCAVLTDSRR